MGYNETVCQLCGVSFAIARLRRADEPDEAAWCYYGSDYVDEADGDGNEFVISCGDKTGCKLLERDPGFPPQDENGQEHLAGPGCASTRGYSGHRISLEEMKGCRAIQCLLKKGDDWQPEPDDQDFELKSNYFLTGIGDGSPDEEPLMDIDPVRHGADELLLANCVDVSFVLTFWGVQVSRFCHFTGLESCLPSLSSLFSIERHVTLLVLLYDVLTFLEPRAMVAHRLEWHLLRSNSKHRQNVSTLQSGFLC